MLCTSRVDTKLQVTTITLAESCHTDSFPVVQELFVAGAGFDTGSVAFAIACSLLVRRHIGEQLDFGRQPVGIDTARAIRKICPQLETISPVNGLDRSHCTQELDVASGLARNGRFLVPGTDMVPLAHIDWSGDFVAHETRSSEGFCLGRYFTNAALVADELSVSIAIALMHAGNSCRNVYVQSPDERLDQDHLKIREGLAAVGIALHVLPRS